MRLWVKTRGCSGGWTKHNRPIELAEAAWFTRAQSRQERVRTHTSRFDERKATSLAGERDRLKREIYQARQQAAAVFWQKMQVVKEEEEEEVREVKSRWKLVQEEEEEKKDDEVLGRSRRQ
ncbi:uncharacterized protein ARB_00839 [Trichophyton benhamiae CBS 112371]|uniref:Uncharacterized protein n=2 Tax=Trichophyton TaxID=5550 RepID=D4AXB1_ARTBC|nr:uncharacterized protein ARB_00839 [Trichophyton benhamiae CBS 112371]EFE32316.1 hypothetical protein ARB_00839 [Trichophyton benhamiae CBS 112371]